MPVVISFFAPKTSGKTTASHELVKLLKSKGYKKPIEILSFASFYKDIAKLIGFNPAKKEEVDPHFNISPRQFLFAIGDFFRKGLPEATKGEWLYGDTASFSTRFLEREISKKSGVVIIDDLRFMDEYQMLIGLDSRFLFVQRDSVQLDMSIASEASMTPVFYSALIREMETTRRANRLFLSNNGTIADLRANLYRWLQSDNKLCRLLEINMGICQSASEPPPKDKPLHPEEELERKIMGKTGALPYNGNPLPIYSEEIKPQLENCITKEVNMRKGLEL